MTEMIDVCMYDIMKNIDWMASLWGHT